MSIYLYFAWASIFVPVALAGGMGLLLWIPRTELVYRFWPEQYFAGNVWGDLLGLIIIYLAAGVGALIGLVLGVISLLLQEGWWGLGSVAFVWNALILLVLLGLYWLVKAKG